MNVNGEGESLRVANSPSLEITGPLTVLVWANANAVNSTYALVYKATGWDDGQMAYMLDLDRAPGELSALCRHLGRLRQWLRGSDQP